MQIINSINELYQVRRVLFLSIVNLAISGEYQELDDAFDIGKVYDIEIALFEDLDDVNIQRMIILCKNMDETIYSLLNLNGIDKEEVDID